MADSSKTDEATRPTEVDHGLAPSPAGDLVPLHQVGGLPVPQSAALHAPKKTAKKNWWLRIAVAVAVLAGAGGGGYYWWQHVRSQLPPGIAYGNGRHDPDLLILDEPTTGVDPLSRRQFWELIDRIRLRRPGMSVVVATAYMEEAERFDWLLAMNDGKILATGSPAALKAQMQARSVEDAFVALLQPEAIRDGRDRLEVPPRRIIDGEPVITARALTRRFGDFTAVDRVSFTIESGEIFGFLGSNGCGKTTTMKMLTGLLAPSEGEALLFGQPLDASDINARRRVGYMSQSFSLYTELTVRQNLELHARLFHLPPHKATARLAELVAKFRP